MICMIDKLDHKDSFPNQPANDMFRDKKDIHNSVFDRIYYPSSDL